ncbi:Riean_0653 family protein [Pontibacter rugosus]
MKRNLLHLLLCLLFITSISSCDKDSELSLPPVTQDARNNLGFKADGKVWVNQGDICNWSVCDDNVVEGRLHKNQDGSRSLVLSAYYNDKKKNISQQFSLHGRNISAISTYQLKPGQEDNASFVVDMSQNDFYQLGSNSTFTVSITKLDTVNHIVSGQFEGVLEHYSDDTKKMTITDGRFDTKLTYSTW